MLSFILQLLPPCKGDKALLSIDLSAMYRAVPNALLLSYSRLVFQCIMWISTFKQVGFILGLELPNCQGSVSLKIKNYRSQIYYGANSAKDSSTSEILIFHKGCDDKGGTLRKNVPGQSRFQREDDHQDKRIPSEKRVINE